MVWGRCGVGQVWCGAGVVRGRRVEAGCGVGQAVVRGRRVEAGCGEGQEGGGRLW